MVEVSKQKTHMFSSVPITLTGNLDGDEYMTTSTLIKVFGGSSPEQNLDLLYKKHGLGKLAAALTYAILYGVKCWSG